MKSYFTLLLVACNSIVLSQPTEPIMRIETGMHLGRSNRISSNADGRYLLTSSNDKTARLWDAATGILLKTFRIPVNVNTREGVLESSCLSPDGKIAAFAGQTGFEWDGSNCIYLVDTQTGGIIRRIKGLRQVVFDLEFSPDGKWIAAGLSNAGGVRIFDTENWMEKKKIEGYQGDVYTVAFKPGGGMATASLEGKIRLYNKDFEMVAEKSDLPGKSIYSIAFNPAGNLLAVGYQDVNYVEVRKSSDLNLLYIPTNAGVENIAGGLSNLSFSADGNRLYGGNIAQIKDAEGHFKNFLRCWDTEGTGKFKDITLFNSTILDIKQLPNGSMAVIGVYPEIAVVNTSFESVWHRSLEKNQYDDNENKFKINDRATSISIIPLYQQAFSFDVLKRVLVDMPSEYDLPADNKGGTNVTAASSFSPAINGKRIVFQDKGERSFCTDISSTGKQIAIGTNFSLFLYDNNANQIWLKDLPGRAISVNISGNNRVVAAVLIDGTIRWYSMEDGKELLIFYLHSDKKKWVLFTPSGYYDASAGAEDFLGWHLNNGADKAPSFFPVSRFKEKFYRPDIIDALFETYNETDAIAVANQRSTSKEKITRDIGGTDIRQKLPPTITINSPANGSNISSNTVSISYAIKSPEDAPVKNLRVLVDGRPVPTERGKVLASASEKIDVTVPSQNCTITLLAENDNGTSPETNLYLKWENPVAKSDEFIYKPKLYVLAIGVSDYNNPDLKLGFAAKDAGDFTDAIYKQKGNLYGDVIIKKLTDKGAAKDSITDGFEWIQKQTGQKDVAMIFFAGHGINDNNGVFYLLPVAADMERIRSSCLNFEELKQTVSSIAGKVVVFIDACHSGNVMGSGRRGVTDINAMVNELSSTQNGAITFTSSTGKEFSLEDPAWGNGAFTKAVIEGLSGNAAVPGKDKVTTKSLDAYISERVKELTKGKQHPTSVTPPNVPDFPISVKQ